jgi:alpha-beta hydrolase superfamily lysophospholipase
VNAQAQKREVDLKAADGTVLKATYFSAGKPGPGIVLLHMCNSQRKAWSHLGESLAARGFHTITIDYRGFGESGGERLDGLAPDERRQIVQEKWPGDIDAGFDYLVAQPGVDRARIGIRR